MKKPLLFSNMLIVGLVRNSNKTLKRQVEIISNAFSAAKSTNWLVIESDSNDDTLQELDELNEKFNFDYITLGKLREKYPKRTERLAKCRNRYLKEIRKNPKYKSIDYIVIVDLDGINIKLKKEAIDACWKTEVEWDACFANQTKYYYDIWALRHDEWCPGDCFAQERFLRTFNYDDFFNRYSSTYSKMITIPKSADPIRVKSAFGGLGIYKKEILEVGNYRGINLDGYQICEHVYLHCKFLKEKKLFIIPSLINGGLNEHSRKRKLINLIILYIATRFLSINSLSTLKSKILKL